MKSFAALIIVVVAVLGFIGNGHSWEYVESPSAICYEVRSSQGVLAFSHSMSPVDHSFCEED